MNIEDLREEFNPQPGGLFGGLLSEYERLEASETAAAAELEPVKTEWTRLREIASNRRPPFHTARESEVALAAANDLFDEFQEKRATLSTLTARKNILSDRLVRMAASLRATKNDLAILEKEAASVSSGALIRVTGEGSYSPHREAQILRQGLSALIGVQR